VDELAEDGTTRMKSLAKAIQESGRTYEALAKATSFSVERITQLANEESEPSYAELRAIAKALKRTASDLAAEPRSEGQATVLFRSLMNQMPEVSQVSQRIDQLLAFSPSARNRSWIDGMPRKHHSRADAEEAARVFRAHHANNDQLGPLRELPRILDSLGVVQIIIHGERIEGASSIVGGTPFIFISPRFSPRMLFTLGHELGHLIVHQDDDFAAADEEAGDQPQAKGSQDPREEKYCQWFASSLLLPRVGVGAALKRFRERNGIESNSIGDVELLFLARFYGVSFFAAANRCEELDLIPRGGALSLYQRLTEDYKNPEERATEVGFPAREKLEFPKIPQAIVGKIIGAIKSGEMSLGKAASLLNVSLRDVMTKKAESLPS
jgi:Zn-dependent peptidase ImmA (M78 family)/transcriptional regulator with XRE-family HTH domain